MSARLTPYACEVRVQTLRELAPVRLCDTPAKAAAFFRRHVETAPWFNPDRECAVALLLNTRRRIVSFELLGIGTKNAVLVDVGEAFRAAIVADAAEMILAHNHPSGDPAPSEGDVKFSRDLLRAGQILRLDLLDSIIIGQRRADPRGQGYSSLRKLGYFYADGPPPPRRSRQRLRVR